MMLFRRKTAQKNILADLGPLYHDYSFFGVRNEQLRGNYRKNQRAKEPVLTAYIAYAISNLRSVGRSNISFAELFCADAYYAMIAASLGCASSIGYDDNRGGKSDHVYEIARRLSLKGVHYRTLRIDQNVRVPEANIVANIGGLYHTEHPKEILEASYQSATDFLIVQNVVSLATSDAQYFESPAPGWTWGSRYSREHFSNLVEEMFCERIVLRHFNYLPGNKRPEDSGSMYYLIRR